MNRIEPEQWLNREWHQDVCDGEEERDRTEQQVHRRSHCLDRSETTDFTESCPTLTYRKREQVWVVSELASFAVIAWRAFTEFNEPFHWSGDELGDSIVVLDSRQVAFASISTVLIVWCWTRQLKCVCCADQ